MSEQKIKICHLTSVHRRHDIRIFHKECISLASTYKTYLIVADGHGNSTVEGVTICDAGLKNKNRLLRFAITTRNVYRLAKATNSDLYHFHDPELIPIGLILRWHGYRVIYDIHEDVPRDILSKDYLGLLKKPISFMFERLENFSARYMSGLITVTSHLEQRFLQENSRIITINNYPRVNELVNITPSEKKVQNVAYVGSVSRIRGLLELVQSLRYTQVKLEIAGDFVSAEFEEQLKNLPEWSKVIHHGHVDRGEVKKILGRALAGIVTIYPEPNHLNSQPIKVYEYMSAGIPVIGSDFPAMRNILEKNNCGLWVDPFDPQAIGEAINFIVSNPVTSQRMGQQGKLAVATHFNWECEEKKLLHFYKNILIA